MFIFSKLLRASSIITFWKQTCDASICLEEVLQLFLKEKKIQWTIFFPSSQYFLYKLIPGFLYSTPKTSCLPESLPKALNWHHWTWTSVLRHFFYSSFSCNKHQANNKQLCHSKPTRCIFFFLLEFVWYHHTSLCRFFFPSVYMPLQQHSATHRPGIHIAAAISRITLKLMVFKNLDKKFRDLFMAYSTRYNK